MPFSSVNESLLHRLDSLQQMFQHAVHMIYFKVVFVDFYFEVEHEMMCESNCTLLVWPKLQVYLPYKDLPFCRINVEVKLQSSCALHLCVYPLCIASVH